MFRGYATFYAHDLVYRMMGAGLGFEGPERAHGRQMLGRSLGGLRCEGGPALLCNVPPFLGEVPQSQSHSASPLHPIPLTRVRPGLPRHTLGPREVQNLLCLRVGPEIVDFGGSKRPPASPKPTGKSGELSSQTFPVGFWEAGGPKNRRFPARLRNKCGFLL